MGHGETQCGQKQILALLQLVFSPTHAIDRVSVVDEKDGNLFYSTALHKKKETGTFENLW